jgi:hypothetical protein
MSDPTAAGSGQPVERESGVALLRRLRGVEVVSFNDVADHMVDYIRIEPSVGAAVDAFAHYLARVERIDHEHGGGSSSLTDRNLS